MKSITSTDGVEIAFERTGSGAPVVLVHGTAGHHLEWRNVAPALAEEYTVYAIDRRGRGESGDADEYSIEQEYEDIAAVVDYVAAEHDPDDQVSLIAHSYGAICALHAVHYTDDIDCLVLYEPPLGDVPESETTAAELEQLIGQEGVDKAVESFLQHTVGMSDEAVELMRGHELWDCRLEAMPTVPREIRATQRNLFDPSKFNEVSVPTTLLVGDDSPESMQNAAQSVAEPFEKGTVTALKDQEHIAMHDDPTAFVEMIRDILESCRN